MTVSGVQTCAGPVSVMARPATGLQRGKPRARPGKANLADPKPAAERRPRDLRHHRRPRAPEDHPRAAGHGAPRAPLDVPVVGVARSGGTSRSSRPTCASRSPPTRPADPRCFAELSSRLRYVDGDYTDGDTFDRLRDALGESRRPLHYLAIPPRCSRPWPSTWLASAVPSTGVVIEKPFGRDLASRAG